MTKVLAFASHFWRLFYWFHCYASRYLFALINLFIAPKRVSEIEDEILLQSAVSLARRIRNGEVTSKQVIQCCINRCREVNKLINAIVEDNFQRALDEAHNADKLIEDNSAPSVEEAPFLGVPFAVKDHLFVKGMLCTAGMARRKNVRIFEDADVVAHMKKAGAIILCMTNVSEMCMWFETYNTIYGRTNNPYDTRRTAGGSSGGQGALIAAGAVPFGIGSDLGGSIRMPAFFNGIFGHKPTQNIISIEGVFPTPKGRRRDLYAMGPMCRYAEDLIPMLKALGGPDLVSKLHLDKEVDLHKLRIFYMTGLQTYTASPVQKQLTNAMHQVIKYFHSNYDVLSYKLDLEHFGWALAIWLVDMDVPNETTFREEMGNLEVDVRPCLELIKWFFGQSDHICPTISFALGENLLRQMGSKEDRRKVAEMLDTLTRQFNELLGSEESDDGIESVFLFPPHPQTAPFHRHSLAWPFDFQYSAIFNSLGLPATCCPLGLSRSNGLPLGVQVVAARGKDRVALAVARELERAFGGWSPPTLASSSQCDETSDNDASLSKLVNGTKPVVAT